MTTMKAVIARSSPGADLAAGARAVLARLPDPGRVLALSWFTDARDAEAYRSHRETLLGIVGETFGEARPPATLIAQAPEGERAVALEAAVLAGPGEIARRSVAGVPYTVVTGPGGRQVHGGGLSGDDVEGDTAELSRAAFARMGAILEAEGLTWGHVVRQWNYVEGMLSIDEAEGRGRQRYQALNDVRSLAYSRSAFPAGYPASTGIGQSAGGVVLEFIALDPADGVVVAPLTNPLQVDAHRYSEGVLIGAPLEELSQKSAPMFERGKLVERDGERTVFISGTASILGQESVGVGDVVAQVETTIRNLQAIVGRPELSHFRAYVKRAEDMPAVRAACETALGDVPALYVRADVCREELLVEIEGAWAGRIR